MLCSNYFFCQSATEIRLIKSANKANEPTAEASMRKRNEYVPFAYRRLRRQMRNGSLTVRFDHATHTSTERDAICQPSPSAPPHRRSPTQRLREGLEHDATTDMLV